LFHVKFEGLATQLWKFEARLNIGATMVHKNIRSKIRVLILKGFKDHSSSEQCSSFKGSFSRNCRITKMLQIDEDHTPFFEDITRDGLPDMDDVAMNTLLLDGPAVPSIPSIPAPGRATQLTSASVSRSAGASMAALPPAGSGLSIRAGWKQWACYTAGIAAAGWRALVARDRVASCLGLRKQGGAQDAAHVGDVQCSEQGIGIR
jgi:hypothetical protein